MKISLVIPTLNESGSLPRLFAGLSEATKRISPQHELEVVLVDDGSTDGTVAVAKGLAVPFVLQIVERKERGLATAVLKGFSVASGDVWGVMDADLSHPTDLLPRLVEAAQSADVVVASRNLPGGMVEEWPWYRKWASDTATHLVRPLGIRVSDPMSGFFFLHRNVLDGVDCSPIGYKILLEILAKGRYKTVVEVPYVFRNREVGKSKMGMREGLNYLRHLSRLARWKWEHHSR